MKAKVAVYDSHGKAINAIKILEGNDFPMKHVSLVGHAEVVEDHIHLKTHPSIVSEHKLSGIPTFVGASAGAVTGILTGVGVFAIPGFGFLYGAGAVIGAITGFDIGLISGGIASALATIGIKKEEVVKFEENLKKGCFMVVVNGSEEEIEKAEHILHTEGTHLEIK